MSYERQDSTSSLQLYRERKVERMAAMRRAVDEGRTNVVSSAQAQSSVLSAREPLNLVGRAVNAELSSARASVAEMQALSEWLVDSNLPSFDGPFYSSRAICYGNLAALRDGMNAPKETAKCVREALHGGKYIFGGAARNVRLNLKVSTCFDLITGRLIIDSLDENKTFLLVSNGQPLKIVPFNETTTKHVRSPIDIIRSNKGHSPKTRNLDSNSTIKNK